MKNQKVPSFLLVAIVGSFLAASSLRLHSQGLGGVVEGAIFRVLNASGVGGWRIAVDSGNDLSLQNLDTAHAILPLNNLTVDQASMAVRLPMYTSTQLVSLTAPATGYMLMNATTGSPCVSTGTAGAWVYISTTGATANRNSCHD